MLGRGWKVGRLAGIPIGIQPLWLAIVALITWSLGAAYYPDRIGDAPAAAAYLLGFASALLLFGSILLHELGHAVAARRRGIRIEGIDLWLLGGVAKLRDSPHTGEDELRYAAAGPAVTVLIAAIFAGIAVAMPQSAPDALRALVDYQVLVNLLILGFNLIPAFPLDGGRILRALIWRRSGDLARATASAAAIGRGFAFAFIGLGVVAALSGAVAGLWLSLIGIFLIAAGRAEEQQQELAAALGGIEARALAAMPAVTVEASTPLEEALRTRFARYRFYAFPVIESGRPVGLLTISRIESLSPAERHALTAGDVAERDPGLFIGERDDVSNLLQRPAFARVGRAVVLGERGEVGVLSATDVARALRVSRLGDGPFHGLDGREAAPDRWRSPFSFRS